MSKMNEFIAFKGLVDLLKEQGKESLMQECYERCKAQLELPKEEIKNELKSLYAEVSAEAISDRIAQIVSPKDLNVEVKVIYQTLEGLHASCPNDTGDWYFSGNYPTPGGNKVVNRAFINYMEGRDVRSY
jgi:amidophosphoribosyltransferase